MDKRDTNALAAKRHSDAKPLLRQLHWLPVPQRIQYKVAVLIRKVRMTGAPSYLSQHLVQHVATRKNTIYGASTFDYS